MRPIHVVTIDKARPGLVLTREPARWRLGKVTIAPITSTVRGLTSEVRLGPANGLDHDCVASCDNVTTVDASQIGRVIGHLLPHQEADLALAVALAFDLSG